jgi:amino acid transporter
MSSSAGAWLQNSMVFVKLILLVVFIAVAWFAPTGKYYANEATLESPWPQTTLANGDGRGWCCYGDGRFA